MVVDSLRLPHVCLRKRRTWESQPLGRKPAPRGPAHIALRHKYIDTLARLLQFVCEFSRPPNQFACSPQDSAASPLFSYFSFHGPTFYIKKHPRKTKSVVANYFGLFRILRGLHLCSFKELTSLSAFAQTCNATVFAFGVVLFSIYPFSFDL